MYRLFHVGSLLLLAMTAGLQAAPDHSPPAPTALPRWALRAPGLPDPTPRPAATQAGQPATRPDLAPYKAGSFQMTVYNSYAQDLFRRPTEPAKYLAGGFSFGYYVRDGIAINLEAETLGVITPGPDSFGMGLSIINRFHFYEIPEDNLSLFLDLGLGCIQTNHRTPNPEGTHFNFTIQAGVGVSWEFEPHTHLLAGLRWYHVSNANMRGADRNPTVDGLKLLVGIQWTF